MLKEKYQVALKKFLEQIRLDTSEHLSRSTDEIAGELTKMEPGPADLNVAFQMATDRMKRRYRRLKPDQIELWRSNIFHCYCRDFREAHLTTTNRQTELPNQPETEAMEFTVPKQTSRRNSVSDKPPVLPTLNRYQELSSEDEDDAQDVEGDITSGTPVLNKSAQSPPLKASRGPGPDPLPTPKKDLRKPTIDGTETQPSTDYDPHTYIQQVAPKTRNNIRLKSSFFDKPNVIITDETGLALHNYPDTWRVIAVPDINVLQAAQAVINSAHDVPESCRKVVLCLGLNNRRIAPDDETWITNRLKFASQSVGDRLAFVGLPQCRQLPQDQQEAMATTNYAARRAFASRQYILPPRADRVLLSKDLKHYSPDTGNAFIETISSYLSKC